MSKTKNFFGCVGISALFWLLSRIMPSIIGALAPNTILLRAVAMLAMLPAGWAAVKALSKSNFAGCIRANLYVFAFLEGIGALEALTYVITNLSYSTGLYYYDINGVAYSDYVSYFGGLLLYEIIYVIFCVCLAKNTASAKAVALREELLVPNIEEMTSTGRSSTIEAVQHKDGNLYIKLRSGGLYLYRSFPRGVYLQMMNAPSIGDFYRQHIECEYPCEQL